MSEYVMGEKLHKGLEDYLRPRMGVVNNTIAVLNSNRVEAESVVASSSSSNESKKSEHVLHPPR